jgi:hypothetical protein
MQHASLEQLSDSVALLANKSFDTDAPVRACALRTRLVCAVKSDVRSQ